MSTVREQYAENTRRSLVETGHRLFAERDYATLSAEEIVRASGLTRGALYHHFDGQRVLFEAGFDSLTIHPEKAALPYIGQVPVVGVLWHALTEIESDGSQVDA